MHFNSRAVESRSPLRLSLISGLLLSLLLSFACTQTTAEGEKQKLQDKKGAKQAEVESTNMAGKIGINDHAPDLALPDQQGKMVSLKDFEGKKVVVLYFYPKDQSPICTAEACSFRDSYDKFKELGAEVIGVSSDSVKSHQKFAEKQHLQFSLLADTSGMARKAFGVPTSAMVLPGRVTYVIDKAGVIRFVFNSMMDGAKHVDEAMKIVKDLSKEKPAS